jgi:hypothetical protein
MERAYRGDEKPPGDHGLHFLQILPVTVQNLSIVTALYCVARNLLRLYCRGTGRLASVYSVLRGSSLASRRRAWARRGISRYWEYGIGMLDQRTAAMRWTRERSRATRDS